MFNCLFFITLAIAFILFILLAIHFKKQLVDNEHTKDNMLVVCNVLAKEMDGIKREINELKHTKRTDLGKKDYLIQQQNNNTFNHDTNNDDVESEVEENDDESEVEENDVESEVEENDCN